MLQVSHLDATGVSASVVFCAAKAGTLLEKWTTPR